MRSKRVIMLTAGGVAILSVAILLSVWAWMATDSGDYEGNLPSAPDSHSVEFTAEKLVKYLNDGTERLDERIDPSSPEYERSLEAFRAAVPADGCRYREIVESSYLRMETSDAGEIAIERLKVQVECAEKESKTVTVEYGVVPEWSSWSMIFRVYSASQD